MHDTGYTDTPRSSGLMLERSLKPGTPGLMYEPAAFPMCDQLCSTLPKSEDQNSAFSTYEPVMPTIGSVIGGASHLMSEYADYGHPGAVQYTTPPTSYSSPPST